MKLNRKWVLVLALALSVAMATTGTLAYLTDEDADVNTMTLGKVEIVQNEQERTEHGLDAFTQDKPLYPAVYTGTSIPYADETEWPNGDEAWKTVVENVNVIDKFVTVTNTGKSPAYVRTIIAYEGNAINGPDIHILHNTPDHSNKTVGAEFASVDFIENVTIGGARFDVIVYTYANPLQAGKTTIPSLKQVYMDKKSDNEQVEAIDTTKNGKYDILVLSQAVQTNGFETVGAAAALNEAFNEGKALDATKVAEWFAGYQTWEVDGEVGSPGEKWPVNNPPVTANVTVFGASDVLKNKAETVTIIDKNLTINTDGSSNWGMEVGKIPLDVAFKFEPTMTAEEAEASVYAEWHADYVVSVNKDIPAAGIGLAGFYEAWCQYNDYAWVMLADPDNTITAGTEIRLVELLGATVNYEEICTFGNDGIGFLCGAVALDGFTYNGKEIEAELAEGTTITVELRLYEADGGRVEDETGEYITVDTYTYTFK